MWNICEELKLYEMQIKSNKKLWIDSDLYLVLLLSDAGDIRHR